MAQDRPQTGSDTNDFLCGFSAHGRQTAISHLEKTFSKMLLNKTNNTDGYGQQEIKLVMHFVYYSQYIISKQFIFIISL